MKHIKDWLIKENHRINDNYSLLKLTIDEDIPDILPGQFVNIRVDNSPITFLRRPISVHFVDKNNHELWLLIEAVGEGTQRLCNSKQGEIINMIYPLGNGFSLPDDIFISTEKDKKLILIGGGAGVAPFLFLGARLHSLAYRPTFLMGGATSKDLLQIDEFKKYGDVFLTTEDGSCGEKGFVTHHSVLKLADFDYLYACGPKPMMEAVAKYALENSIPGEVSLGNLMACGTGACLCCVEKTIYGNLRVCTEGPVMNIKTLTWQI